MIYRSNPPPIHSPPRCESYRVHEVQKKEPWLLRDTLDYMRDNAGTQFDPYWVGLLLACEGLAAYDGERIRSEI